MKNFKVFLFLGIALLALSGCTKNQASLKDYVDIDLTKLSSTMVYSEIYNMMVEPDAYIGKSVRVSGTFNSYMGDTTNERYYAVVVTDANACCEQRMEFILNNKEYPKDYPSIGENVCVVGKFEGFKKGEYDNYHLVDANIEDIKDNK